MKKKQEDVKAKQKEKGEKAEKEKKDKDHGAGPGMLPKRLRINAFSKTVGHRLSGLQTAQVKLLVERFPSDFRLMALHRFVLPMKEGLPYMAPDGMLPCPALSTIIALRYLQATPGALDNGSPRAVVKMMQAIFMDGLQVEWMEFDTF